VPILKLVCVRQLCVYCEIIKTWIQVVIISIPGSICRYTSSITLDDHMAVLQMMDQMNKSGLYERRYNFGTLDPFCLTVSQIARLKKIVHVIKRAFHVSLQLMFTFHLHKYLASYTSDMHRNARASSGKLVTIGFWRWCITFRNIEFSDYIHRPGIKKQTKGNTTETDPVSETSCFPWFVF
jgi:hypothetical protein